MAIGLSLVAPSLELGLGSGLLEPALALQVLVPGD
jgi:hypothetical protein